MHWGYQYLSFWIFILHWGYQYSYCTGGTNIHIALGVPIFILHWGYQYLSFWIFILHWGYQYSYGTGGTNICPFKTAVIVLPQKFYTFFLSLCLRLAVLSQRSEKRLLAYSCFLGPSICPHGTTCLSLDGFSWNFIIVGFAKLCQETSDLG